MGHRRNHVASSCYLAEWAGNDGYLRVVRPPALGSEPSKPNKVGYRIDFWGKNPQVRRALEEQLGRIESDVADALRGLPDTWPPRRGATEWFAIAYLVAIHLLRTPYTQARLHGLQQGSLKRQLAAHPHWRDEQVAEFVAHATSDAFRADLFADMLQQAAAFVASMHWTLIEFPGEALATSDQPVTVVPLLRDGVTAPIAPVPAGGLHDCEEIRIALGPRLALLLTWLNEPDDYPRRRGSDEIAASLNRAVIAQADEEWFHHPSRRPTTTTGLLGSHGCGQVGRALHPGYGYATAIESQRRRDTLRNLEQMVDEQVPGQLRIAGVRRTAA